VVPADQLVTDIVFGSGFGAGVVTGDAFATGDGVLAGGAFTVGGVVVTGWGGGDAVAVGAGVGWPPQAAVKRPTTAKMDTTITIDLCTVSPTYNTS